MPSKTTLDKDQLVLLTGRSNPELARKIGRLLGRRVEEPVTIFADSERHIQIPENVRKRKVVIIHSTSGNQFGTPNDHIMELFGMIDAARRASAEEITVVIPYFAYARQDRKDKPRVPIMGALLAYLLQHMHIERIVTVDIHAEQEQGFVQFPWDNLYAAPVLLSSINRKDLENIVVVSPDIGGVKRARTQFADRISCPIALVYKERDLNKKNTSKPLFMVGNVKEKNVLLVDDILDTAGTLTNAAALLKRKGARKIIAVATHGLFSNDAIGKIGSSAIDQVIVTDTIELRSEVVKNPKVKVVSIAALLAEAIKRIYTGDSLNALISNPPTSVLEKQR